MDRTHNVPKTPALEPDPERASAERQAMKQGPYRLDQPRRAVVLESLREACSYRKWTVLVAHVRSNHVHVVLDAPEGAGKALITLKACASRGLNRAGLDGPGRRRWSRHGSTRYLWKREHVEQAIAYVAEQQGEPMALYVSEDVRAAPFRSRLG